MKLISWNVNGIRACVKKGFLDYLKAEDPDIICLQETKARIEDVEEHVAQPSGYHAVWHSAEKRGYSGVATFTKKKPNLVLEGFGIEAYDREGRVIMTEFDDFVLFNVYFPNGTMDGRMDYKMAFYTDFFAYVNDLKEQGKNIIVCGDYNTAHTEIDLARPKANVENSGFTPVERAWMDRVVAFGYVDTFRNQHPGEPDHYTWWTYRGGARDRNIGWRIDYFFVDQDFLPRVQDAFIRPEIKGSDHCPLGITIA